MPSSRPPPPPTRPHRRPRRLPAARGSRPLTLRLARLIGITKRLASLAGLLRPAPLSRPLPARPQLRCGILYAGTRLYCAGSQAPTKATVPTSARTRACAHMHTPTHARSTHACKLARSLAHALRRRHARTGGRPKQANRRPDGDATRKARCAPAGNDDPLLLAGLVSVSVSPASPFSLYSLSLLSLPLSLTHSLIHTYTHTHTHTRAGGHRVRHESSQFLPDGRGRGHSPHRWRHQIWRHQQSLAGPRGQRLRCSGSSCISACTSGQTDRGAEGVCTRV